MIDFGQNIVGWLQVRLNGKAGDRITISHAEILDKPGNFYTENLRSAKEQNTYIVAGNGPQVFEPHFSWQGFRYIKVEGINSELLAARLYRGGSLFGYEAFRHLHYLKRAPQPVTA